MNSNYIIGPFASAAATYFSCGITRYLIRNNIYETGNYKSDVHVLRDKYEQLSPIRKVVNGVAQIYLAALTSALIHAALGLIFFKAVNLNNSVRNFAIIGAVIGAIVGTLHEPKIGDFIYYNVLKNPYTSGSAKYM